MMDPFDFPPELCSKPLALIGLTGLDTLHNAVHRTIWDAFSNSRRQYRAAVQFKLLDAAHEFPPVKSKRTSYDWYIPKGILKRNWMNKHLNELPAVVVIFYELDWDDQFWNEKSIECASRVQSVRAALDGRGTRIAVILVQQTAPLPTGEDMLAAERAAALCTSCELNPKSLFVLPHGDHLQGYTHRLENAFYDLAQNYYHHETRNIKSHRDHLNKTTHQYLFVRHLFKMGFLNELKQDGHNAQRNYTQAYNNLLDLRMVDTNALEVKTVAGFVNYKLCKIMFQLSLPRDAIAQFRKHTEIFKNRIGPKDLAFEHHAWMSKQFCVFGDIFDEAIRQGLPALQTQHPGFYYQQSAQHASDRKEACLELCKDANSYPDPDPLSGWAQLEFYGQRAWRPGKLSAEPPDPEKEKLAIQALQYLERHQVNHSMAIIGLLGNAISQFKTYRCPRMRRHLVVQMAEEYYVSHDYGKALTLLTHMLWDYRCEKWWQLLTTIVSKALNCAYLSANIQDYIVLSLEALGSSSQLTHDQKTRVYNNLMKVLKKMVPDPEPDVPEEEAQRAQDLWTKAVGAEPLSVAVEMSNLTACVESKARFTQAKYKADQPVKIEVFISSEFAVCEDANPQLLFNCNQVRRYVCQFVPDTQDVGKEIQIGSILLTLGSEPERNAVLRFTGTGAEPSASEGGLHPELQHFRPSPKHMPDFDNVRPLATAEIVPRDSKLRVEVLHDSPALLGEWYPIKIVMENKEDHKICNIAVSVNLQPTGGDEQCLEQATQLCEDMTGESSALPIQLALGDLEKGSKKEKCFSLRAHRVGNRNVTLKGDPQKDALCAKEDLVSVPVVKPFDITAKFFSLKFEPIAKAFVKEPFIVMPYVNCASPFPLLIEDSSVELSQQVQSVDETLQSQLKSLKLKTGETGADAFCVSIDESSEQPIALGVYTLKWRSLGPATSSSVTMPTVRVDGAPLYVEMDMPAHGWVRTPMAISYHIRNRTTRLLELELNMEASDAFMFAGHKQLQLRILPESVHRLDYNLYPLLSGLVALPRLRLTVSDRSDAPVRQPQLVEMLDRSLPTHVFVMPQGKGNPLPVQVAA
ncbi:Trafficking protein particle complex subunit 11 [Blattella germanica]|nr:Trafficking protein particle complex subunit 11 [Blattella germanica]